MGVAARSGTSDQTMVGKKGKKPAQRPEKARAKKIFMSLVLKLHAQSCV
jgi:hypothetical protein